MSTQPRVFQELIEPPVALEERGAGVKIFRCLQPLAPFDRCVTDWLLRWANEAPERVFLAQRTDGGWRETTYADAFDGVQRIGQALLERDLSVERPVMILSGNGIEFALLSLAAMHVGVPVAPVSPAYSLMSREFEQLTHICDLVTPGLVYASDADAFARPLELLEPRGIECVTGPGGSVPQTTTAFSTLLDNRPTDAVTDANAAVSGDTIAKFLFTSGSTGVPKGVINTQRMLCSNQQALAQLWTFLDDEPPTLVDWLPWHHTFGGNYTFNLVLRNGGTLYIDEGKPAPGMIEETVRNLREVSPTIFFNVPVGYQALLPHLEEDGELREAFFERLRVMFYAAAALPPKVWTRLENLANASSPRRVAFLSAWGSTETAPLAAQTPRPTPRAGAIGVPAPGTELKLCPSEEKTEVRVRGPNVTPGYWRQPELTAAAFDEEGFYRMGDAVRLADPEDASAGLVFDGRIAEDFKLLTGTWVSVGKLRTAVVNACAPLVQDVVIAGHDRNAIGALVLLNPNGCRSVSAGLPEPASLVDAAGSREVRAALIERLRAHNEAHPAATTRIERAILLTEPFSIDRGELTDKGYVNQRGVLKCRAELVECLYAGHADVLRPDGDA